MFVPVRLLQPGLMFASKTSGQFLKYFFAIIYAIIGVLLSVYAVRVVNYVVKIFMKAAAGVHSRVKQLKGAPLR